MRITGWFAVQKSGFSDKFKAAIRARIRGHSYLQMSSSGWQRIAATLRCPLNVARNAGCRYRNIQTGCLKGSMIATYEGKSAHYMLSVEALLRVEGGAVATAAGLALRVGAPAPVPRMPEAEAQVAARKETARLMEYGGVTQLCSMRALMAKISWRC